MIAFADKLKFDLERRARDAFDALGKDIQRDLKTLISVQVVGSGRNKVRSLPGEPPRRETGRYQNTVERELRVADTRVSSIIFTDYRIGRYLESGTSRMQPRPHFRTVFNHYARFAAARIGERMFRKT